MGQRVLIIIAGLLLLAFVYAENRIVLQIGGKKVDIVAQNESKNPYLYNPRLLEIQKKLNKTLLFNLTNYAPVEESGFYNKETAEALEKFREMYYKKYNLQRYYAFSAGEAAEPSSVEGLLDREVPAAANFAREYQESMKLKNGDPARWYGNSAWDEVRRIEKGLDGDTVDPVTGELTKTLGLYQTPVGNDHLMPIALSARYGSQYPGNCGMGGGWYLTENYALWFSYEKNEMIVQDGSGVSQKFAFSFASNQFVRGTNETTDGGYFLDVSLEGSLGSEGSRIIAVTGKGDTLEFEYSEKKGQDTVANVLAEIDKSGTLYGYSVINGTVEYKKGLYQDVGSILDLNVTNGETLSRERMICDKGAFTGLVNRLSDISASGWSVGFYEITGGAGVIHSFRRQGTARQNVYAGYTLRKTSNRFHSYKEYQYNGWQKLSAIRTYSPAGSLIDSADYIYTAENEKAFIGGIMIGAAGNNIAFGYSSTNGTHNELSALVLDFDGKTYGHGFQYNLEMMYDPWSREAADLSNSIFTNYNNLVKAYKDLADQIDYMTNHENQMVGTNLSILSHVYDKVWGLFYPERPELLWKTYQMDHNYFVLLRDFMIANLPDMQSNIDILATQASNFISGDLFPRLALLAFHGEGGGSWHEYRYGRFDTNTFGVTNMESAFRTTIVRKQGTECGFDYGAGETVYRNFNGAAFTFKYGTDQDYAQRRVERIVYPGGAAVSLGYDKKGNITAVTNEIKNFYEYRYDDSGNVTSKRMPGGREWSYSYGSTAAKFLGRPTEIRQPDNTAYKMEYDRKGELLSQKLNKGNTAKDIVNVSFQDAPGGYIKTVTDMYGSPAVYAYDSNHSLIETVNPDGGIYTYSNDNTGKPLMENRGGKATNVIRYDSRGNAVEQGISGLRPSAAEYDAAGRRLSAADPLGNKTTYIYGSGNKLIRAVLPTGEEVRYSYDGDGNKTAEAYYSRSGAVIGDQTILYSYDARGRLTGKALVQEGQTFHYSYGYDSAGNLALETASAALPDGSAVLSVSNAYAYDAISLLTDRADLISGKKTAYIYDPMGRPVLESRSVTNGSAYGLSLSNTYDVLGRGLETFAVKGSEAAALSSNIYIDSGRVTVKFDKYGNASTNYTDFRDNVTNLRYAVFNPLTEKNEIYSHSYIYDTLGNKIEEIYPDGARQKWTYAYGSRLSAESRRFTDENAAVYKRYGCDDMGHLLSVTDFEGKIRSRTYDSLGHLASETDPDGRQISYVNDIRGNPVIIQQGNRRKEISYNLLNKPVTVNYGDGTTDAALYDALGNVVIAMPGGPSAPLGINSSLMTEAKYDSEGRKVYEKGFGLETTAVYDARGNLIVKTAVSGPSTLTSASLGASPGDRKNREWRYNYDAYGRLTNEVLPDGSVISRSYAVSNGLVYETITGPFKTGGGAPSAAVNTYDQMDRLIRTAVVDEGLEMKCDIAFFAGKGLISGKIFDRAGLPVKEVRPGNKIRVLEYTPDGLLKSEVNEAGETNALSYDKNGNLVFMKNFDGSGFSNAYYGSGKIMKSIEPGNAVTSFYYDAYGNLNKKTLPGGETWLFETDARGRFVKETNPFGGVTAYEYDALGRKTKEKGPGGRETSYLYTGGLPSATRWNGNDGGEDFTINVSVDGFGETNNINYPGGGNIIFYYDNMGRVTNKTEGDRLTRHSYTQEGRTGRIDNPDGTAEIFAYNAAGLLTNRTLLGNAAKDGNPPKRVTTYYYGPSAPLGDRIASQNLGFGDVEISADYRGIITASYFDKAGRPTNRAESVDGQSRNTVTIYGFMDVAGIHCRTIESWKESEGKKTGWTKTVSDFRGNTVREYRREKGQEILETERSYNADGKIVIENRQLPADSAETRYEYSVSGMLSKKTEPSGLVTEYAYDVAGRIIQTSEYSSGESARVKRTQYYYHKSGNLKKKTILDFSGSIAEDISYGYDFRGNITNKTDNLRKTAFITIYNTYGGKITEKVQWEDKTTVRQYKYDPAGRLYQTTDELGGVTEYTYGDYGQKTGSTTGSLSLTYQYDNKGNMISESQTGTTRENNNETVKTYATLYNYDEWGNRTKTIYSDRSFDTAEYDVSGIKIKETDRYGYAAAYEYDENGRIIKQTQDTPGGKLTTETDYDTAGRKVSEKSYGDASGQQRTVNYIYDASGRPIRQEINGISTQTGYDSFGNKIWTIDYNGNKSYYNFDALGRTIKTIDPEGNVSTAGYVYDNEGKLAVTTVHTGTETKEIYDGFGNKIEAVDPNENSEFYQYNEAGKLTVYKDRNGNQTEYVYDTLGRQTAAVDPDGSVLSNVYDSFNNIIEVIDKENRHLYREFDWQGRMVYSKDALGNSAAFSFTTKSTKDTKNHEDGIDLSAYEKEEFTDAEGNNTITYRLGKLTLAIADALGNTTRYQYNAFGELTATIDPKGNTTKLVYDLRGNKISETTALGFTTSYTYDNNGNVILEKNGEGQIRTVYNKDNQPVRKEYSDGNTKTFAYDSLGRLTRAGDNFSDYSYLYDNNGNLTNRYDAVNKEILAYEYDSNGNRSKMIANGKTVNYEYDALNQVSKEIALSGGTTNLSISYAYTPMGRLTNKTYSSGLAVNYEYDPIYRLTKINNATNNQFLSSFEYSYDKVGNRTGEKTTEYTENTETGIDRNSHETGNGVRVSSFTYDSAYRLIKANYDQGKFEEFSYDNSGNRLKKTSNLDGSNTVTINYVYDNDNRLLCEQKPSGNISYIYDRAGRLVKKTEGDKVERYQYNQRDLMTKYTVEKGGNIIAVSEYTYDINNLRIQKKETPETPGSVGDNTTRFTYDGDNILTENGTFYLNNIMINGYEAEIQPLRAAVYIKDALGSVRGEIYDHPISLNTSTPSSGTTVEELKVSIQHFNYTAFGEMMAVGDNVSIDGEGKKGISYTGSYFDKDSKLYYNRARYYDASAGRFISSDPINDPSKRYSPAGLNRYVYGDNRPLYYTDPDGEWINILIGAIIGGICGTINGILNFTQTGDLNDIWMGYASGTASGAMNGAGIPAYISFSTRGFSAGAGYTFGGLFNAGGGFHSDWSGQNYGFSASVGMGMPGGAGFSLTAGLDYSQQNGWGTNFGANVSFGIGGNTTMSLGGSVSFNSSGQMTGAGANVGIGSRSEADAKGNYYTAGGSMGLNYDAINKTYGGNFGLNASYNQQQKGGLMSYSESIGLSVMNGHIVPYGNYSASLYMKQADNAETKKMAGGAKTLSQREYERELNERNNIDNAILYGRANSGEAWDYKLAVYGNEMQRQWGEKDVGEYRRSLYNQIDEMTNNALRPEKGYTQEEIEYAKAVSGEKVKVYEDMNSGDGGRRLEYYRNVIMNANGDSLDEMLAMKGTVIISQAGLGVGTPAGMDNYNDRITLIKLNNDGTIKIEEYYQANMVPTNDLAKGREYTNSDPFNTLAEGRYAASTFRRDEIIKNAQKNPQLAKLLYNLDQANKEGIKFEKLKYEYIKSKAGYLPLAKSYNARLYAERKLNGDNPYIALALEGYYESAYGVKMSGVMVHEGAENWNGSVGCLTIHPENYEQFMQNFGEVGEPVFKNGSIVGNTYDYSKAWQNGNLSALVYVIR